MIKYLFTILLDLQKIEMDLESNKSVQINYLTITILKFLVSWLKGKDDQTYTF